jgi:hypothetical protein
MKFTPVDALADMQTLRLSRNSGTAFGKSRTICLVSLLSGNAAPLTIGVAGIVVSVLCSWVFYWLGGRLMRRENGAFLKEINELRKLLADYVQSMSQRLDPTNLAQTGRAELLPTGAETGGAMKRSEPNAAVEELVRASLGALVNERGEVDMSRLMREVSLATGTQDPSAAFEVLRRLRSGGVVEWDASDEFLPHVRTLHVQPWRAEQAWPPANKPGGSGADKVSAP